MNIASTLNRYIARTYLAHALFLLLGLLAVVYLFDTVELIRRASKRSDVPMTLIFQMGLLKLPEVGQILFPFAILFSAMFTFWTLNRRYELVVVRAAGFSVWQFLTPFIIVAAGFGILQMTIINPVGAVLLGKFERLENRYLEYQDSEVALFEEGLWLRQRGENEKEYVILHAEKISPPDWTLKNLTVFFFGRNDRFIKRLEAEQAYLQPGEWVFKDITIYNGTAEEDRRDTYPLPTHLTIKDIEESFSSPETMSFWRLPSHIKTLEDTGFDASRLRVHYQTLLAQPLFFAAMILLAAAVSLRPPRLKGSIVLLAGGILVGFIVFFTSSFLQALGASGQIPVILAAWSPAVICILLGVSIMMGLEDG